MFVRSCLYLVSRVEVFDSYRILQTRVLLSKLSSRLLTAVSQLVLRHRFQYGPHKTGEFSGNGGDGDMPVFTLVESPELLVETMLGFQGNSDNGRGLPLATSFQDQIGTTSVTVVPGGFDQESSGVNVAGLGDGTSSLAISGRSFRRHEAEVGHQ